MKTIIRATSVSADWSPHYQKDKNLLEKGALLASSSSSSYLFLENNTKKLKMLGVIMTNH